MPESDPGIAFQEICREEKTRRYAREDRTIAGAIVVIGIYLLLAWTAIRNAL
jgi:hypothetical protein